MTPEWVRYAAAWQRYAEIIEANWVCEPVMTYAESQRYVPVAWERAHAAWYADTEAVAEYEAARAALP